MLKAEDNGDDGDWNICWDFERNDWGGILTWHPEKKTVKFTWEYFTFKSLKMNMFYQASVLFVLDFAQLNHTESQQVCSSLMSHVSKCAIVIHCPLSWMKTLQVVAGNPLHLGHLQVNPCGRHHFLEAVFCTDLRESKWCVKNVDSNQCMNFLKHVPTISCHFRQMFIPYFIQVESSIYFTVHYLE